MKSHNFIRKFIPVFDRLVETWISPNYFKGQPSGNQMTPRYARGEYNYWNVGKTSKPKKIWAIMRVKIKKTGQKDFFPVLLKETA